MRLTYLIEHRQSRLANPSAIVGEKKGQSGGILILGFGRSLLLHG